MYPGGAKHEMNGPEAFCVMLRRQGESWDEE